VGIQIRRAQQHAAAVVNDRRAPLGADRTSNCSGERIARGRERLSSIVLFDTGWYRSQRHQRRYGAIVGESGLATALQRQRTPRHCQMRAMPSDVDAMARSRGPYMSAVRGLSR